MLHNHAVSSRNIFPGIEQTNEAYDLVSSFTENEAYKTSNPRPLPTPTLQLQEQIPASHIYDEPKFSLANH